MISRNEAQDSTNIEELKIGVKELLLAYEKILANSGYGHIQASRGRFSRIDSLQDLETLRKLVFKINPCLEIMSSLSQGPKMEDSPFYQVRMMNEFLKRVGLVPRNEFLDIIESGDVLEVYDSNAVQAYRSFNFFAVTSYSLEEIFTYEWFELYQRDESLTNRFLSGCQQILTGKKDKLDSQELPTHRIEEKFSPRNGQTKIKPRIISYFENTHRQRSGLFHCFQVLEHEFCAKR